MQEQRAVAPWLCIGLAALPVHREGSAAHFLAFFSCRTTDR